jgi:hypothetical protein
MFRLAKASAVKARVQAINQLKAVLVCADPILRESLSGLSTRRLIGQCAQLSPDTPSDITSAAVYTLQLLARRVLELTTQINDLNQRITEVLTAHAPQLLDHYGVGPDTAAVLLVTAGDNPQRLHSEASCQSPRTVETSVVVMLNGGLVLWCPRGDGAGWPARVSCLGVAEARGSRARRRRVARSAMTTLEAREAAPYSSRAPHEQRRCSRLRWVSALPPWAGWWVTRPAGPGRVRSRPG